MQEFKNVSQQEAIEMKMWIPGTQKQVFPADSYRGSLEKPVAAVNTVVSSSCLGRTVQIHWQGKWQLPVVGVSRPDCHMPGGSGQGDARPGVTSLPHFAIHGLVFSLGVGCCALLANIRRHSSWAVLRCPWILCELWMYLPCFSLLLPVWQDWRLLRVVTRLLPCSLTCSSGDAEQNKKAEILYLISMFTLSWKNIVLFLKCINKSLLCRRVYFTVKRAALSTQVITAASSDSFVLVC